MTEHIDSTTTAGTQHEDQEEQRVQTDERMSMDGHDMEEAIDHEQDQKVDPGDQSRYEDNVDQALSRDKT